MPTTARNTSPRRPAVDTASHAIPRPTPGPPHRRPPQPHNEPTVWACTYLQPNGPNRKTRKQSMKISSCLLRKVEIEDQKFIIAGAPPATPDHYLRQTPTARVRSCATVPWRPDPYGSHHGRIVGLSGLSLPAPTASSEVAKKRLGDRLLFLSAGGMRLDPVFGAGPRARGSIHGRLVSSPGTTLAKVVERPVLNRHGTATRRPV